MQTIKINASKSYEIFVGKDILDTCGEVISALKPYNKAVIVTDDIVDNLYANKVEKSIEKSGIATLKFVFENGEKSKSHETLLALYDFLVENQITRSDILIALGGGVVGDLTGFASATYLRGVDFVQIPTTLLAQTDSSIGGKTAVNIASGKNLVGAFKQPECVICDLSTLSTLSDDIYADGMSEIIKYAMIKSKPLFDKICSGVDENNIEEIITECINIKKYIVEYDEFDKGERMLLNFGHTLGHAVEKHFNFTGITHGKAVAIGMMLISNACEKNGLTENGTTEALRQALEKFNLQTQTQIPLEKLIPFCLSDKKRENNDINIIVASKIGESYIKKMSVQDFRNLMGVLDV